MPKYLMLIISLLSFFSARSQHITGTVYFDEGKLQGVSIFIKDSFKTEYLTDINGEFSIINNEDDIVPKTLIFMKDGFLTEEYVIDNNEKKISVFLSKITELETLAIEISNSESTEVNKITYRVNHKALIENSKGSDALSVVPMLFKNESQGKSTFYYKNEELQVIVDGNSDLTDIGFIDADEIEKIELYPDGNLFLSNDSNKPLINIILNRRSIKTKGELSTSITPLLDQVVVGSNFVLNKGDFFAVVPITIGSFRNYRDFEISNNKEKWKQINKRSFIYTNPTFSYDLNSKSKLTSTSYVFFSNNDLLQESKNTSATQNSKDKNNSITTSISYEYNLSNDVSFTSRLYYSHLDFKNNGVQDNYNWNSNQKTDVFQGEIKFKNDNKKFLKKPFNYFTSYSFYNQNSNFSQQEGIIENIGHRINLGSSLKMTDDFSFQSSVIFVNTKYLKKSENFILPNIALLYQAQKQLRFNLSYYMSYNFAPAENQNETPTGSEYFEEITGNTNLQSSVSQNFKFGISKRINKYNLTADFMYSKNNKAVLAILTQRDDDYVSYYSNGGYFNTFKGTFGFSTSFFKEKLFVQSSITNYFFNLQHKEEGEIIKEINEYTIGFDTYLKLIINKNTSISLSASLYSNRYEVYSYDKIYTPKFNFTIEKNLSSNFFISLNIWNSFKNEKVYRTYNQNTVSFDYKSGYLRNTSFISLNLRYSLGKSKIKNPPTSSLQTDF